MDTLTLNGLQYRGKHGYYEQERTEGNTFEVDLIFGLDLSAAASTDDLENTLNYQEAEGIVKEIMHGSSVKLIETLAQRIGQQLLDSFPEANKLEVRVRKLSPPLETKTRYSEVTMTWPR